MLATRDAILGACEALAKPVPLDVPELGGTVYLRYMSAAEAAWLSKCDGNRSGAIAAIVLADEHGARLFTDAESETLASKIPNKPLERIVRQALEMNVLEKGSDAQVEAELDGDTENPTA